tara:strand:+ start:175 stop:402 length:228 start_codon:yes stop_codon:yes gene_type:complete
MEVNNESKQIIDYLKTKVPTDKSKLVKDLADMVIDLREKNVDLINHNANLKAELKELKDSEPKKWYQVFKIIVRK